MDVLKIDPSKSISDLFLSAEDRPGCIFAVLDGPMAHARYKLLAPGSNLFLFTSPKIYFM